MHGVDLPFLAVDFVMRAAGDDPNPFSALNPSTWDITHFIAVGGFLVSALTAISLFRKDRKAEQAGAVDAKMRLDKMIDERMQANLTSAWDEIDELKKDRDELKRQVAQLRGAEEQNGQIKDVVKKFFTRLVHWNAGGRQGEMPMPDPVDVGLLGLEHPIEDTLTTASRNELLGNG